MKSMTLHDRGFMVSFCALALLALLSLSPSLASWLTPDATAKPPRTGAPHVSMARTGTHSWGLAENPRANASAQAVPRGNLRGDIADNARRSAAPRPDRPDTSRNP
ncbi:hypothetical protein LMG28688_00688 [Paraburkholderia caffeinitolerans]|uniref:Secreted protein n=1 Tax=Paraburkholderia caffeinitolerans TaxID=1723730 RepID=A0A6J5FF74_9BURK|nr:MULTISPECIES: hypothetical protein [Paraburkholderia]CAB3779034.1 hypothetical protein LMG28688_00688 [Paraburkholderia caffeinitolerans]